MITQKLEFHKAYSTLKGLDKKFAFGKILDGKKTLVFLNGETSEHIAYEGINLKDGVFYRTSPATCGYGVGESEENGSCNVGVPNPKCIASKIYSKSKCAVYFIEPFELDKFKYNLSIEELNIILNKLNTHEKQ